MEETLQTRQRDSHIHEVDTEDAFPPLSVSILGGAKISSVPEEGMQGNSLLFSEDTRSLMTLPMFQEKG